MNNILLRTLTGSVFISLIIGALWWSIIATLIVMSLFLILGLNEFHNLFEDNETIQVSSGISITGSLLVFGILMSIFLGPLSGLKAFSLVFPILFLLFISELWRKKEFPIINIGVMSFCIFYLVIPFSLMISLSSISTHQNPLAIGMFLLIWTNDTFAYLSGRFFGKTKLFERISPKKTWEGTIGGTLFTVAVAYFIGLWSDDYPSFFWIIAALIIAPCSIFGDLLESLFKRSLNIKDSGNILPGHGGILDRFDAALFTVPFFYCWVVFYS
jgi:phosphatidate cytidylyltransferase